LRAKRRARGWVARRGPVSYSASCRFAQSLRPAFRPSAAECCPSGLNTISQPPLLVPSLLAKRSSQLRLRCCQVNCPEDRPRRRIHPEGPDRRECHEPAKERNDGVRLLDPRRPCRRHRSRSQGKEFHERDQRGEASSSGSASQGEAEQGAKDDG